jgi:hypothetical protein
MRKNVILRDLAELILCVGWCGVLTRVPFWENDRETSGPVMGNFFWASTIIGGNVTIIATGGQEITLICVVNR